MEMTTMRRASLRRARLNTDEDGEGEGGGGHRTQLQKWRQIRSLFSSRIIHEHLVLMTVLFL